jgi:hypothetical protein
LGSCKCIVSKENDIKCDSERSFEGIFAMSHKSPPLVIFTNTIDRDVDIECPEFIRMFGEKYRHRATTFLRRAGTVFGSGHFIAAIKFGGTWNLYDGCKSKSKPPYFTKLSTCKLSRKYGVTPFVIIYEKMSNSLHSISAETACHSSTSNEHSSTIGKESDFERRIKKNILQKKLLSANNL